MRILVEALGYGAGDNLGGSGRVAAINARAVAQRGHEVWFCCTNLVDKHRKLLPGGQLVERDGVHVVYCDTTVLSFWPGELGPHYARVPKSLLPPISSFDIVHLTEFRSFLAARLGIAGLNAGVAVLLQPHGTFFRHERSRWLKRLYDSLWGVRLATEATFLLASTQAEAEGFARSGVSRDRIRVVPNGIEVADDFALPARGMFRASVGLAADVPVIVSVGRIDEMKGFDLMLRGLVEIPEPAIYVVVGPDSGFAGRLKTIAAEMRLTHRLMMIGPLLTTADLLAVIVDADVMVVPSRFEAFGQVILEGLLARRPLVLSSGCNAAVNFSGIAALVAPPEPAALAAACRQLLDSPAMRQEFGQAGYDLLRRKYMSGAVAGQLEEIYDEARGNSEPGGASRQDDC
jgi:glycosyltransferase involved in cell wall biosynthesis